MKRPHRRKALLFLVRRHGNLLNWDCTHADIARAIGVSEKTVREICKQRGYVLSSEAVKMARTYLHAPPAVDSFMRGSFVKERNIY